MCVIPLCSTKLQFDLKYILISLEYISIVSVPSDCPLHTLNAVLHTLTSCHVRRTYVALTVKQPTVVHPMLIQESH